MVAVGLGRGDEEDVAACDGDGTSTGSGALVPGRLAAGDTLGDTHASSGFVRCAQGGWVARPG
jgi:hypothetical protein